MMENTKKNSIKSEHSENVFLKLSIHLPVGSLETLGQNWRTKSTLVDSLVVI